MAVMSIAASRGLEVTTSAQKWETQPSASWGTVCMQLTVRDKAPSSQQQTMAACCSLHGGTRRSCRRRSESFAASTVSSMDENLLSAACEE